MQQETDTQTKKETELKQKFCDVFNSPKGKEVIEYIIYKICGWEQTPFSTDQNSMYYIAGHRAVAHRILALCNQLKFQQKNNK